MNAPDFDHSIRRSAQFVRGTAKTASRWGDKLLPGGKRTLWVLVGVGLVVLLIWAVRPSTTQKPGSMFGHTGPTPVGVAHAARSDVRVTLDALGTVTPLATVTVKPQVSGILDTINFREGQLVKAGDELARIDPRPYQAALDQAKGQLARDQAQLANAHTDLKRYQALSAQNAIAGQTLATQQALVRTDEGTVKADAAAVEAAAVNLGYCRITSPVAGRVGLRQVDVGNLMQPGVTTAIVVVTELQPISVLFTLPEDDIDAVMQRLQSGAKLVVDVYDRNQTAKLASGTLATADNQVDPTTGTVKLRALFDNADGRLFPQEFVNVRLLVRTLPDQTTVPAAAVQRGAEGDFVYVVSRDHSVSVRPVSLGPIDGAMVDVSRGLRPGETIVVDGADRLKDGAKVSIPGRLAIGTAQGRKHRRHWHSGGQ